MKFNVTCYNTQLIEIAVSRQHWKWITLSKRKAFITSINCMQINYMIDPEWLKQQYISVGHFDEPLLILYGGPEPVFDSMTGGGSWPKLTTHFVSMSEYAHHHSKMMLLAYKDGSLRIVVSTANLSENEWHDRIQGLWISDKLEAMPSGGEIKIDRCLKKFPTAA